jgi:arginase
MNAFPFASGSPRLIGLPYDAKSSFLRGPAEAPPLIRAALGSPAGNSFSERLQDVRGLSDAGDLALADVTLDHNAGAATDAGEHAVAIIERGMADLLRDGFRPVALGGDHSVTWPVMRAVNAAREPLTIVHIDAHPDLYDHFEGDRLSHACPFARIMEDRRATRLVQVGIRTMTAHQRAQADRFGVEVVDMPAWSAGTRFTVDGPCYFSIDLDALDPAFAPGVSHREPGGLSTRDIIGIIQGTGGHLVGADIVEYNPRQDIGGMTALVAAKLVKEVAGRMLAGG